MKTRMTVVLTTLLMSLTLFASETTRIYKAQETLISPPKMTDCPNRDRSDCTDFTMRKEPRLTVGSIVELTTPKSSETYVLQVSAIKGPFDKDGNIQGADIEFIRVKQ